MGETNQIHYTPKKNFMNDPNGMVYFEGEYHMFYQHHPHGDTWGPMHWGHAVSTDMIKWTELPIALYPDDLGYIFSGCAVVDGNNTSGFFDEKPGLVAFFTHHSDTKGEMQSIAYSYDCGRTWKKYEGNPVIPNQGLKDFRDPKVLWHVTSKKWIMVTACGDRVRFHVSEDLKNWIFKSEFGEDHGSHGGVWECPDLFELPVSGEKNITKWVLKVDVGNGAFAGGSGGQYFIGSFDGITFISDNTVDTVLWLDYGQDFYAAQSFSDIPLSDGRRIWLGWMNNWKYANQTPTVPWRGMMSVPRELKLIKLNENDIRLVQNPIAESEKIRARISHNNAVSINQGANMRFVTTGDAVEIIVEIRPSPNGGFRIVFSNSAGQKSIVGYNMVTNSLYLDRSESGNTLFNSDFNLKHLGVLQPKQEKIKLHIIIDRYSIEVFGNDGEIVISSQVFPETAYDVIEWRLEKGEAEIISFEVYYLKP